MLLGIGYFIIIIFLLIAKKCEEAEKREALKAANKVKALSDYSIEEKMAYNRACYDLNQRCRELSENSEVTYFSMDDIDRIISDLKKEEK